MKHKKLSISIVSAFIAALGLTACSNITENGNNLVSFKDYNGNPVSIDVTSIYNEIKKSEDGVTSFYNAILEVMIRDHYKNDPNKESVYNGFVETAKDKVAADHKKAKSDANTNGTSYDDEWKAILDAAGVKDEKGLEEKYLYDLEKEDYTKNYFDNTENKAALTSEYIGYAQNADKTWSHYQVDKKDTKTSVYPYHIRHILVKTDGANASDFVTSEITKEQATKLSDVYKMLYKGTNTFGEIAQQKSDDGSKSTFGDAGIMTTKTSFVNEFKLGIYAYDLVFANSVTGDAALKSTNTGLGLHGKYNDTKAIADVLSEDVGLEEVPFAVFEYLGDVADVTTNAKGQKVNDGIAKSFPRNIVWNNYLNLHNPFVITDETIEGLNYAVPTTAETNKTGFRNITGVAGDKKVLTDEDGRVIVGVRSEFGIHFMIMERTPFETNGTITGMKDGAYVYDDTAINEYYTTVTPGQAGYPQRTVGETKVNKNTYVNYLAGTSTDYAQRASTVKSEIKGFDKLYDYRIFNDLVTKGDIKFADENVHAEINKLMAAKIENAEWTSEKEINDAWNTYLDKINLQYEVRNSTYTDGKNTKTRLVKMTCAINFEAGNNELFKEGGLCYYEA